MPKLKAGTVRVTAEEDKAINAAALSDPDAQPLIDEQLRQLKPVRSRDVPLAAGPKCK